MFIQSHPENLTTGIAQRSEDTSMFEAFVKDPAALIGMAIAALGVWLSYKFNNPFFDPGASVIVGLVLIGAAFLLIRKNSSPPISEPMDRYQIVQVLEVVVADSTVESVDPFSNHTAGAR
ncbi:MAG TPA: hypothetical protein VK663_13790 [Burkholderiales bacterium]|nr:hypothetical protein [Burkholderiales bacterium]